MVTAPSSLVTIINGSVSPVKKSPAVTSPIVNAAGSKINFACAAANPVTPTTLRLTVKVAPAVVSVYFGSTISAGVRRSLTLIYPVFAVSYTHLTLPTICSV